MGFLQDFRYAAYILRRTPGISLVAIFSLALGIGANTAIFSVVNTLLLRPLNYAEPDRLVRLWETFVHSRGQGEGSVSVPNLIDWREMNRTFEGIGAYSLSSIGLSSGDDPVLLRNARVTADMFGLLGVEPLHGRTFAPGEDQPGQDGVVVLSYALWQNRFAGDPSIVGQQVTLNGSPYVVVGVMPASFDFPPRTAVDLWVPLTPSQGLLRSRGSRWMRVVGRLKSDVTLEQAQSDLSAVAAQLTQLYPQVQDKRGVVMRQLHDSLVRGSRPALLGLFGAVGLVLLIGCANAANLQLARSVDRRREFAIRGAMGADRPRLLRQLLTESLLLAFLGGALGLALSQSSLSMLMRLPGADFLQGQSVELDFSVLAFCFGACLLTAVVSGVAPALRGSKIELHDALKERGSSRSMGASRDPVRAALVAVEVALAVVVLVGAALLLQSYNRLTGVDSGTQPERVLTASVTLPGDAYSQPETRISFFRNLHERVSGLPGVEAAGLISRLPIQNWGFNANFTIEGMPSVPVSQMPVAEMRYISGKYFSAMGIPLLEGQPVDFDDASAPVRTVLVNQAFARRFFEGEDPIGKRIGWGSPSSETAWLRIVGVVANVRGAGLQRAPQSEVYMPFRRSASRTMSLVVRTTLDPTGLTDTLRGEIRAMDPSLLVYRVNVMQNIIDDSVSSERFTATLFGAFAGLALLLSVVGVFGAVSYTVGRRGYEIAVRMALGAERVDVLGMVLRGGLWMSLAGVGVGALASLWLTRYLQGQLYSIQPNDPLTLISVCLALVAISVMACYLPARRAMRVEPVAALREE